ncbi:MAG: hypothetical protein WAV90_21670 [Gordonia amarae]
MVELTRHSSVVSSVFDLLGKNENDLTAALGFTLANCPSLLQAVLKRLKSAGIDSNSHDDLHISIEKRDKAGRTDLEIQAPAGLLVFEAKRDWLLPTEKQLRQYVGRIQRRGGGALVTLSQASRKFAEMSLPKQISGVPVIHLPWMDILRDIDNVRPTVRGQQRIWLDQLRTYLQKVIRMRSVADSWTFCVVLNDEKPGNGGAHTFLDFVTKKKVYFHPYGVGGWPTEPPNFLAFRWHGAVQRIHRVDRWEVINSLLDRWPDIPATPETERRHLAYKLGPRLPPLEPVPNGNIYPNGRVWMLLDQLQACKTVHEAVERSKNLRDAAGER